MESDLTGSEPNQPEEENGVDIPSLISRVKGSPPAQMNIQVFVVTVQPEALSSEPKHPRILNLRSRKLPQTTMQYKEVVDILAKDHLLDYPDFTRNSQPSSDIANFETVVQSEIESPSDLLKKQVYYMDKSPQQKQIDDLSGTDQPFVDIKFPASYASLFGSMQPYEKGYQERKQYLDWRSIFQVIPQGELFVGGINPSDIKQKGFGDCYFLVGLSALAERPQRIRDIFLKQEVDKHLYFACTMMLRGRWQAIYVDQKFPLQKKKYKGEYGASRGSQNQLWVPVLEKAWSKLYGSYYIAEGGFTEEALHDLTGAHIRYANTRGAFFDKEKTWERLLEGTNKGFAMLAESPQNPDPITKENPNGMLNENQTGMVFGHAYTILGAYEIDYKGKTKRLLRCRNPWGFKEWGFEWSTLDPKWNKISEEEKRRVRYEDTKKGGQFFIHYDDCCEWLTKITIGEIHDSYSYVYTSQTCKGKSAYEFDQIQKEKIHKGEAYFKVTILKEGEYSFQLNQTSYRLVKKYPYRTVTMSIGRVLPNGDLEYYRGAQWNYQIVYRKHTLPPGEYIVYAKQEFYDFDPEKNKITLGIYGQYYCTVEDASQFTNQFHARLLLSRTRQLGQQLDDGVLVANEVLGSDGLLYAAVINDTQKPVSIMVKGYSNLNKSVGKITDREERIDPKKNLVLFAQLDLTHRHRFNTFTSKLCRIMLLK